MTDDTLAALAHDAKQLVDRWTTSVSELAQKSGGGSLTADDMVKGAVAAGTVAMAAAGLAFSGMIRLGSISAGTTTPGNRQSDPVIFSAAATERTLRLAGPLRRMGSTIPAVAVTIVPATLPAGATECRLVVDATGRIAGIYAGTVEAVDPDGTLSGSVDAFIEIE